MNRAAEGHHRHNAAYGQAIDDENMNDEDDYLQESRIIQVCSFVFDLCTIFI